MLTHREAYDRALVYAIRTGDMPELSLIHRRQASEGMDTCFGRARAQCPHTDCHWYAQCMALASVPFEPTTHPRPLRVKKSVVGRNEPVQRPLVVPVAATVCPDIHTDYREQVASTRTSPAGRYPPRSLEPAMAGSVA